MKKRMFTTTLSSSITKDVDQDLVNPNRALGLTPDAAIVECLGCTVSGVEVADWQQSLSVVGNVATADKSIAAGVFSTDSANPSYSRRKQTDLGVIELHDGSSTAGVPHAQATVVSFGTDSLKINLDEPPGVAYLLQVTFLYECDVYFHKLLSPGVGASTDSVALPFSDWDLAFAVSARNTEGVLDGTATLLQGVATYDGALLTQRSITSWLQTASAVTSDGRGGIYTDSFLANQNKAHRVFLSSPTSTGVDLEVASGSKFTGDAGVLFIATGGDLLELADITVDGTATQDVPVTFQPDSLMTWAGDIFSVESNHIRSHGKSQGYLSSDVQACTSYLFETNAAVPTTASSEHVSGKTLKLKDGSGVFSEASAALTASGFTLSKTVQPATNHWLVYLAHKEPSGVEQPPLIGII